MIRASKDIGLENNFTGLNNSRQTSVAIERINDVASHMLSQYNDCKNAKSNAMEIFTSLYESMKQVADYFKQVFAARGVPTDEIYCREDEATQSIMLSVLWQKVGFTLKTNDRPLALEPKSPSDKKNITYRILAIKGDCIDIIQKNPENYTNELLKAEVASLYVPVNKNEPCEIRFKYLSNERPFINQQLAASEFFLNVVAYTCGGGSFHKETEYSTDEYWNNL